MAARVGTSQAQIHKLETGQRKLTVEWMQRLGKALDVAPIELIQAALAADLTDDVRPYRSTDPLLAAVSATPLKGLEFYEVVSDSLEQLGYQVHDLLLVDGSKEAIGAIPNGAAVIVRAEIGGRRATRLRQFIAPALLVTNRSGRNDATSMNSHDLDVSIVGVVLNKVDRSGDDLKRAHA